MGRMGHEDNCGCELCVHPLEVDPRDTQIENLTALLIERDDLIEKMRSWGVPEELRICVNCGKFWPANKSRLEANCEPPADLPEDMQGLIPCTADYTYGELIDEIHRLKKQTTALDRAMRDLRKSSKEENSDAAAT